jgi:hypothetical protein
MKRLALAQRAGCAIVLISVLAAAAPAQTWPSTAASVHASIDCADDAGGAALRRAFVWTGADLVSKNHPFFVAFRRRCSLAAQPNHALLRLFADTRYELWINGIYVQRGPCRFVPNGPEYDVADIARLLKKGDNTLAILVMARGSNGKMMRHDPGLAATLTLDDADRAQVQTDGQWTWNDQTRFGTPGISWGNVADNVDMHHETGDWTQGDFDDTNWQHAAPINAGAWGPLTARRIPLLRETPQDVKLAADARLPIELHAGQQLAFSLAHMVQAFTELDVNASDGTQFELKTGNIVHTYITRAGLQHFMTTDTAGIYHGSITVKSGSLTVNALKITERIYPFDCVGSFKSSDPMLDKVWSMCTRSLQLLSEDAYDDCADRERTEWMDCDPPAFDVTQVAMAGPNQDDKPAWGDSRLLLEMIRRTALTLQPDGWVKAHTCSDRFDIHAKMEDRACDWIEGVRRYFEQTKDPGVVREIWPAIRSQLDWFLDRRTQRGLVKAREWVVWGNPLGYQTCEGAGLNAFIFKALVDGAWLGDLIGEKEDAQRFQQAADDLKAAFNSTLWDSTRGTYFSGYFDDYQVQMALPKARKMHLKVENNLVEPTMFPALFALDQGIVPADRIPSVTQYLLANRGQASRVMTFYYLFKQMYAQNDPALDREVLDLMRKNWKAMANWPWESSWEEFTGGSRAHCYGMFPAYFLSAYVLGVRAVAPAFDGRIIIEPRLGDLTSAEGAVLTPRGPVHVAWKDHDGVLSFEIEIPTNEQAELRLAGKSLTLDGAPSVGERQGGYLVASLSAGKHHGSVSR